MNNWNKTALSLSLFLILKFLRIPDVVYNYIFNRHQAQVDMDVSFVGPTILSILAFTLVGILPNNSELESFSKRVGNFGRGSTGIKTIVKDMFSVWEECNKWIMGKIKGDAPDIMKEFDKEVDEWAKAIIELSDITNKKKTMLNVEETQRMSILYQQGLKFKKFACDNRLPTNIVQHIAYFVRHAEKLFTYAEKNNVFDGGCRVRPLCIVLCGESQIGKSTMVYPLAQDLLWEAGFRKSEDLFQQMYARQPETEFFDGYKQQHIVVCDDALAMKDDTANPNVELMETIRMLNDFPHHLHMASLEDKNTYNTSKVVIMTVNDIKSRIVSLSYPEAFYNRIMDHCYEVRPKLEFRKEIVVPGVGVKAILDKDKLRQQLRKESEEKGYNVVVSTEIYEFVKYEKVMIDGKMVIRLIPDFKPLNYDEFSTLMCKQQHGNLDMYGQRNTFMVERLRHKAQMGEQFHDATSDDETCDVYFSNIITKGLCEGKSFSSVELEILQSQDAERYLEWKRENQTEEKKKQVNNELSVLRSLYTRLKHDFKTYLQTFVNTMKDLWEKYNFFFCFAGATSLILAGISLWNLFENKREDVTHEEKAELVFQYNVNGLPWSSSVDVSEILNCQFDFVREENGVQYFVDGFDMECEAISSPSAGQMLKQNRKLNVEAISSPSAGQMSKLNRRLNVETLSSPTAGQMRKVNRTMNVESTGHKIEGVSDENAMEVGFTIMRNNFYRLSYDHPDGTRKILGNAIVLSGFNVLIPYHFVHWLKLRKVPISTKMQMSRINYKEETYNCMIEFDLAEIVDQNWKLNNAVRLVQKSGDELDGVIFCPSEVAKMHLHRNIVKHFIGKDELNKLHGSMKGFLISYRNEGKILSKMIKDVTNIRVDNSCHEIDIAGGSYIQREGYLYNGSTQEGDCGAPLILKANSLTRKIVGMHVSGSQNDEGYSIRLSSEILEDTIRQLKDKMGHRVECYLELPNLPMKEGSFHPEGTFIDLGKMVYPLASASRSVIAPSPLYGQITKPITKPAHLKPFKRDGVVIDPALLGLKKCGVDTVFLDKKKLEIARNTVRALIHTDYKRCGYEDYARVLGYEEAIRGNDDVYMSAVCRTTSPGYPFNSVPGYKQQKPGKTAWMGSNENFDFTSEEAIQLKIWVEKLESDCRRGKICDVICADTKKDERRPIAKVDEGKTRMFSSCPMHYVVLFRQYYLGFASFLMHNRNHNGIAVGTNPYSMDWDTIARKLKTKGKRVIAGDFSNFDGSLNVQVLWKVYDIIEEFYKKFDKNYKLEHARVRYSLWVHLVNSVHVLDDTLYQWTHSQPSGNPFTVILNSIYNELILVMAYLEVIEQSDLPLEDKRKLSTGKSFVEKVSIVVYGDDNCLNIDESIISLFNQETISKAMLTLGHTYTEESKSTDLHVSRTLPEINFLKRGFVWDNEECRYLAPLDIGVIYEMMNWIRTNDVDTDELLIDNIHNALREMSLHGREKFAKLVNDLNENEYCKRLQIFIPTFEEARMAISVYSEMEGLMA